MKQIAKISEPNSLLQHRAQQHSSFDNIPSKAKEDLRQNLLLEQGYICCYCMKRIPEKVEKNGRINYEMKIEHFQCQERFSNLQLSYANLYAACTGNEGKPKKLQTCDTKKGNLELNIALTSRLQSCETLFKYNAEGEISSIDNNVEVNRQIIDVLNLNMQTLKDSRSEVYFEVQEKIRVESKKYIKDKAGFIQLLKHERAKWVNRTETKYKPFCMVAVYYLNKKIRQANK